MIDKYTYIIVALLPLSALMLVFQTNPYHALVIRAILGAVAVLVYIVLGAADVALTEALVGTMLAVTLYVIAVRSSLVMRLGIVEENTESDRDFTELITHLRKVINKHYLRLELIKYPSSKALEKALQTKELHAIFTKQEYLEPPNQNNSTGIEIQQTYHTAIRVHRLFEILQTELSLPATTITYVNVADKEDKH
jgi:putative multicomponent Na+:H+ antiporter subunit B